MGLEATSWNWLRDGIKRVAPHSLLERVENGVLDGMADVNYVILGSEGWIETKAIDLPTRDSTPVVGEKGMRLSQVNWHLARQQVLGRTWVFISAAPYRWLINGCYVREINTMTRDDMCMKARLWYDENWTKPLWEELVRALTAQFHFVRKAR